MKYLERHIATAASIIKQYDGSMPLSNYLKQHFAANKKYGGKDRKHIAHFCFLYYRLANATKQLPIEETIKIALFVTSDSVADCATVFAADWLVHADATLTEKLAFTISIYPSISVANIFQLVNELSEGIDVTQFATSHLIQPDLFLRIRPKQKDKVIRKLQAASITFSLLKDDCLALPNTSKIDEVLQIDREVVVQDYSSQRIAEFLSLVKTQPPINVWDCCAASGGKSILVADVLGNVKLTVSDIRATIIQNLKNRLAKAGIAIYHTVIADLAKKSSSEVGHRSLVMGHGKPADQQPVTSNTYQLIICDAPCSGSGTWGRTPEQLAFFKQADIAKYVQLQQQISTNTIKQLAPNGYFLYITCSVFKQENEDIVDFILQQNPSLVLVKQDLLIGYDKKADTMFAALFQLRV